MRAKMAHTSPDFFGPKLSTVNGRKRKQKTK